MYKRFSNWLERQRIAQAVKEGVAMVQAAHPLDGVAVMDLAAAAQAPHLTSPTDRAWAHGVQAALEYRGFRSNFQ